MVKPVFESSFTKKKKKKCSDIPPMPIVFWLSYIKAASTQCLASWRSEGTLSAKLSAPKRVISILKHLPSTASML